MNSDILKGNWMQIKGSLKETFGALNDDDMLRMEGSLDQAVGVIQERYGYTKERAQQEWDKFVSQSTHVANSMTDSTGRNLQDASNSVSTAVDNMFEKGSKAVKNVTDAVKDGIDSAKDKLNS